MTSRICTVCLEGHSTGLEGSPPKNTILGGSRLFCPASRRIAAKSAWFPSWGLGESSLSNGHRCAPQVATLKIFGHSHTLTKKNTTHTLARTLDDLRWGGGVGFYDGAGGRGSKGLSEINRRSGSRSMSSNIPQNGSKWLKNASNVPKIPQNEPKMSKNAGKL